MMSKISRILKYLDNGPIETILTVVVTGTVVTTVASIFVQYTKNNAFLTNAAINEIFNKFKSHEKVKELLGEPIDMLSAQVEDKVRKNFAVKKMKVSMELKGRERNGSFLFWLYQKEKEDRQKEWMIKNAVMGIDDLPDQIFKINLNEKINAEMEFAKS